MPAVVRSFAACVASVSETPIADVPQPHADRHGAIAHWRAWLATTNQQAAKKLQENPSDHASLSVEFYLSGDPASRWVTTDSEHARFGIAFDLFGDESRILVASKPATVALLRTREPEPHPGLIVQPVLLGIKVAGGVKRV